MSQIFETAPALTGLKFGITASAIAGPTLYTIGDDGFLRTYKNVAGQ